MIVEHPRFGLGTLVTRPLVVGPGPDVVARFEHGLQPVSRDSLRFSDGEPWPLLPRQRFTETLSESQRDACRWLEALRMGTVAGGPGHEPFTVGRKDEQKALEADLEKTVVEGGACRVFRGPYGVGKSHLISLLRHRAQQRGLAVSQVVLDRSRVSASRPRRLYHEFLSSMLVGLREGERPFLDGARGAGEGSVLSDLLDLAVAQGVPMLGQDPWHVHAYLTPLLRAWRSLGKLGELPAALHLKRELLHWATGGERCQNRRLRAQVAALTRADHGPFYALKDFATVWNQMTYLLTGWAALLKDLDIAPGWVLILDEAEMCTFPSSKEQRQADRVLTGLAAAALGRRGLKRPELLREPGGHAAVREFPPFYRGRSHIYLVLGLAGRGRQEDGLGRLLHSSMFAELRPLDRVSVDQLVERVLKVYKDAFPHLELGAGFCQPLSQIIHLRHGGVCSPRQIVQQALAFLDGARLWPEEIETFIEEALHGRAE